MQCLKCGFDNRLNARFCGQCGGRLFLVCAACGVENPPGYNFCDACGERLAEHVPEAIEQNTAERSPVTPAVETAPQPLEGERRVATIILADVKGSTDLMERVGTEAWVNLMNRVLQILETEVYRFGGKVDQFRGDGLVAFFGTTFAHEDDPERAVLAALAMQQSIQPFAEELQQREGIDLVLRVGVNTGEVIVTRVGNDRQYREDTAMGEAIALAARMETAAEPGTVLVSENTYRLVPAQFEWTALGKIMVKGISTPVTVYRPLAPRAEIERSDTYELGSPFIGREREVETLKQSIENLSDGIGGIVTITGEQGMGKSLLTTEVRHFVARQDALLAGARDINEEKSDEGQREPGVLWLRGRCRSYNQSRPFSMWQDALRSWLDIAPDEPVEQTRDRLREQAEMLWGHQMGEYYPDLATLLSLPLEDTTADHLQRLDADSLRQHLFLTIQSWIETLTRQGPLVLNFSDMQWADATSLDLLKYCLPLCEYTDLLWLCVFRPDRTSPIWELQHYIETEFPHRLVELELPPLTVEQSRTLIQELIGPDVLPPATQDLIIGKAEGNPYYLQELIRSLIVQGILVREPETKRWYVTQAVTDLALPDSLHGLLLSSIDRLSPGQQHVLQMASVIGVIFWSDLLETLVEDRTHLRVHLRDLQRAQLIRERGRVPDLGVEYIFQSSLIRDAAYDSLLSTQRTICHLRVADHIENRCCEAEPVRVIPQFFSTLAYHYRHAGRLDKELYYTQYGAEHAQKVYANAEARAQYTHALELLDELELHTNEPQKRRELRRQRFKILDERRAVSYVMGQFDAMRADAQALLPLATELDDDPVWRIDALLRQPGVSDYQSKEELDAGIPMAQEALALAQQINDQHREMECLIAIVNHRLALSDPSWQPLAERALGLARTLEDLHYEARLLVGMGGIYAFSDQPDRSMEYLEAAAALTMRQGLDDKIIQMSLLNLLGLEFERNGDYYRLLTEYQEERLHISQEIGHRPFESKALQACGRIHALYLGDFEGGLALLQACQRIVAGTLDEVFPLFHIAQVQTEMEEYEDAQASLERICIVGEPVQDRGQASLDLVRAILYNALGDEEHMHKTLELADGVCQLARQNPLISQQYEMAALIKASAAHFKLAELAIDEETFRQHRSAALETSQAALQIYQAFGFVQITECVTEEILYRHSQALAFNGRHDEAITYLRRAYEEMTRKHALIPTDSYFRRTYLENIPLHQEIRAAYATRVGQLLTESGPVHRTAGECFLR